MLQYFNLKFVALVRQLGQKLLAQLNNLHIKQMSYCLTLWNKDYILLYLEMGFIQ